MTSAFLQTELTNLISDSKKRSNDVRTAAERSLSDLRSITVTSEVQLAADLSRSRHFIDPFVLACQSKNAKLANPASASLQRLVASRAVPSDRLEVVLNAFGDAMNTSYEVQLKILQTLPALLQLYASEVRGLLLAKVLDICANLERSKTNLVSSSARATFEQLVDSVFERARLESQNLKTHERKESTASITTAADDAGRIFEDLCSILNNSEPTFLQVDISSSSFVLDTLEKIIDGNAPYIRSKSYLVEACRAQLLPGLVRLLHRKEDFHVVAQALRITHVIVFKLPQLLSGMEELLDVILRLLERDGGPPWKRVLALEFFQQLCSDFGLMIRSFATHQDHGHNFVIRLMATFVRIAAEDPSLIGLGKQSTIPIHTGREARQDEMASIEVQGIGGGGLASVSSADANVTGLSADFSTTETRLLDNGESSVIPTFPKTYLYALILECISSFCEGLSKFIMPLSVSSKYLESSEAALEEASEDSTANPPISSSVTHRSTPGHKYQRLANPLKMSNLPQLQQVQASSTMIDRCWPAMLATCSTFLNAALDSHFYHMLIRSMQKLAQVSGTLELSTPRDALLTSLAKGSVPPNATAIITMSQTTDEDHGSRSVSMSGLKSPTGETPRSPFAMSAYSLNVRHLLCLRALLNLGIALGPTLTQDSWFIIFETLQQVETLMSIAGTSRGISWQPSSKEENRTQEGPASLAGEMSAVNAATKRMIESTRSYSDKSFAAIAHSLLRMVGEIHGDKAISLKDIIVQSPATLSSPTIHKRSHQGSRSVSGLWAKTKALDVEVAFVLTRTKDLVRVNLYRFASTTSTAYTWDLVVSRLLDIAKSTDINSDLRLQATSIVDLIAMEVMKLLDPETLAEDEIDQIQCKCLEVLASQIAQDVAAMEVTDRNDVLREDLYKRVFEALENILGHSGDSFHHAWETVFKILRAGIASGTEENDVASSEDAPNADLSKVTPVAFRCLQLICNDFMQHLDGQFLERLIELLFSFGAQNADLNMSLTTASLLRNVATLLETRTESIDVLRGGLSQPSPGPKGNEQVHSGYLWSLTVTQLRQMCLDPRADVRDASVRILLQVIEAASEKLAPRMFALALDTHLYSTMRGYQEILSQSSSPDPSYSASLAKLIEGSTTLMGQNMEHLMADDALQTIWESLLKVLRRTLAHATTALQILVFESLAKLFAALRATSTYLSHYGNAVLELWAAYDPSNADQEEVTPNQDLLAAHVNLFVQVSAIDSVSDFAPDSSQAAERVMSSIRCALLTAKHTPYTNDVRKRTKEQEAAYDAIQVLANMLSPARDRYVAFLLELIQSMLLRPAEEATAPAQADPTTGKMQQPTYIAMASSCLDLLRQTLEGKAGMQSAWTPTQFQSFFQVLSPLIRTKYTPIPTNTDAPLWQNATTTAITILEAARSFNPPVPTTLTPEQTTDLNASLTACLASILGSGGLEPHSQSPSSETLTQDEAFDVAHFQRFHSAALPFLSSPHATSEQRKQYILVLFHASLVAKPWFFDFPFTADDDVTTSPLRDLMRSRKGSVHPPQFPRRSRIPYTALDALFDMVDPSEEGFTKEMAVDAAPCLLLRIVHPMKVFLADQPLRGLTPLAMPYQEELKWVLERCLGTMVDDECFDQAIGKSGGIKNGKSHLRILFALILKTQKGWRSMMRLPDGTGWQDDIVGQSIENALERWVESVGEGWGVGYGH